MRSHKLLIASWLAALISNKLYIDGYKKHWLRLVNIDGCNMDDRKMADGSQSIFLP